METKFETKEEAKAHILGIIAGLNEARIQVMGIGYDQDETARMMRRYTLGRIFELKEILEIDHFGSEMFESANELLNKK